jgi:hypothetical protein
MNNLKQIGLGLHNYLAAHGTFPSGHLCISRNADSTSTWCSQAPVEYCRAAWTALVLPYLEQGNLHAKLDFTKEFTDAGGNVPAPNSSAALPVTVYRCPTSPGPRDTLLPSYVGVQGGGDPACWTDPYGLGDKPRQFFINGLMYHNSRVTSGHVRDGLSNTLLVGETRYVSHSWLNSAKVEPNYAVPMQLAGTNQQINLFPATSTGWEYSSRAFGSYHAGGCFFVLGDGSVHFLSQGIDINLLRGLGQRADGTPVGGIPTL